MNPAVKDTSAAPALRGSTAVTSPYPRSWLTWLNIASKRRLPSVGASGGYPSSKVIVAEVRGRLCMTTKRMVARAFSSCSSVMVRRSPVTTAL